MYLYSGASDWDGCRGKSIQEPDPSYNTLKRKSPRLQRYENAACDFMSDPNLEQPSMQKNINWRSSNTPQKSLRQTYEDNPSESFSRNTPSKLYASNVVGTYKSHHCVGKHSSSEIYESLSKNTPSKLQKTKYHSIELQSSPRTEFVTPSLRSLRKNSQSPSIIRRALLDVNPKTYVQL